MKLHTHIHVYRTR